MPRERPDKSQRRRPVEPASPPIDASWSSQGLGRHDAIGQWQDWAANTIAPIDVSILDAEGFAAAWRSQSVGQLRFLHLIAPAQRVVHRGTAEGAGRAVPSIQLVYARKGVMQTNIGEGWFDVGPGQFVLLDNTRFYEMTMDTPHEAIDLMLPRSWVERWLPDPDAYLGQSVDASSGWGAPLGGLIEAMAADLDATPLPRPLLAEQIGALLAMAIGVGDAAPSRHGGQLLQNILRRVERDFADPDLTSDRVARELGISKRYLQVLLAGSGTSFVQELTRVRIDQARDMLADPRTLDLQIAEVAFRCGFLDAGYFTRQFGRRVGLTPRVWRQRCKGN